MRFKRETGSRDGHRSVGKITIGEGEALEGQLHSLLHQARSVAAHIARQYVIARARALVSEYTTVTREGGSFKNRQHYRSCRTCYHHQAAPFRDVRLGDEAGADIRIDRE